MVVWKVIDWLDIVVSWVCVVVMVLGLFSGVLFSLVIWFEFSV